ncbi:MAG: hypothetical protein Q4P29_00030 [Tissierellia bacterium]|nr:hypothetical protein [Tissierellia bacterium]
MNNVDFFKNKKPKKKFGIKIYLLFICIVLIFIVVDYKRLNTMHNELVTKTADTQIIEEEFLELIEKKDKINEGNLLLSHYKSKNEELFNDIVYSENTLNRLLDIESYLDENFFITNIELLDTNYNIIGIVDKIERVESMCDDLKFDLVSIINKTNYFEFKISMGDLNE